MILLCGGEGAAGVKTGGVFFLLVSYAGRNGRGGHRGVEEAARRRAQQTLLLQAAGLDRSRGRS